MKSIRLILLVLFGSILGVNVQAQGLKAFKLPNGLSVYVWEDEQSPDVTGIVAVNVGSKEDPEQYTGLAHYLEHMMFKGTDKIGALDWAKEEPIYNRIIAKYDEMANEQDPAKKSTLSMEINSLTREAAKYSLSNEFSTLLQGMGGTGVNAGTSLDYTIYYNSFPAGEIYKWLEIYSERLIRPVFRSFQTELETVYEEFNRGQDQQSRRVYEFIQSNVYPGHPYSRSVIGLPEHLKNPRLSELTKFYNNWYVPQNMALVLVGNIKTKDIIPLVREKFGRLENKPVPERKQYPESEIKGRKEISAKIARNPQLTLVFPGITSNDPDEIALDICTSLLTNSSRTGLLDKLVLEGDLLAASASSESLKERGTLKVMAIPVFDMNLRRFESLKSVEKTVLKEIKKLQDGQFDDQLVQSIKSEMIRMFDLSMESSNTKANIIAQYFLSGRDMGELLGYKEMISEITTEQIKAAAKKYFGDNYLAIHINEGKPEKGEKLEKPKYDPIQPVRGAESEYAKMFQIMPVKYTGANYPDINSIETRPINEMSKLYYNKNTENEIFTMTLRYGIGTDKMPKLGIATSLMNNAGIMAQMQSQELKQAFSNLGTTCRYSVSDSYLYVTLYGFEANLEESCNLLTRQILMPQLDDRQLNSLKGSYSQQRRIEKNSNETLSDAMRSYLLYQDKSEYLDRLTLEEISAMTVSSLSAEFQKATNYEAQIFYAGAMPLDDVHAILSRNLPLKEGEMKSSSPEVKDRVSYSENTIYFLPNSDAQQSTIYFYIQGDAYDKDMDVYKNAFNQYFSGGFSGLVLQEIREYRSMAYTAGGYYVSPQINGKPGYFMGNIGTQNDKVTDAIEVFMGLLNDMPPYPDRVANIRNYMKEVDLVSKPSFRDAAQVYESWKLRGYTKSPAETNVEKTDKLTFADIEDYYKANIQGRPVAIGIVGDPKLIDLKALEKYGKVIKLSDSKLFSNK